MGRHLLRRQPAHPEGVDVYSLTPELGVGIREIARQARRFLVRSVTHVAGDGGVDQFLDIGTGLPATENTHEVAQRVRPNTRVVYVDNDSLVLVHARTLLTSTNPPSASPTPSRRAAASANGYTLRSVEKLASCFDGLDLLEPGVVSLPFWRPEPGASPEFVDSHCGVARKP